MNAAVLAFLEGPDLVIVLVILLVVFGGGQLPKLARSLGQAKKELDEGLRDGAGSEPTAEQTGSGQPHPDSRRPDPGSGQ